MRIPFNALDEGFALIDDPTQPLVVQIEARVSGRLDVNRLREALGVAASRHPMARARVLPWRGRDPYPEWQVDDEVALDTLRHVECDDVDDVDAVRSQLLSTPISLYESPPWRARLISAPDGDILLLAVHHSASDGMGCLRLLQSVLRAYADVDDPVPDLDPIAAHSLDFAVGSPTGDQRRKGASLELRKLRNLGSTPARVAPDGDTEVSGYGIVTRRLTPDARGGVGDSPSRWCQRQRPTPGRPPRHHRTMEHGPRIRDRSGRCPHADQRPARTVDARGGREPRHG